MRCGEKYVKKAIKIPKKAITINYTSHKSYKIARIFNLLLIKITPALIILYII
jgi:hypothetical protein